MDGVGTDFGLKLTHHFYDNLNQTKAPVAGFRSFELLPYSLHHSYEISDDDLIQDCNSFAGLEPTKKMHIKDSINLVNSGAWPVS